MRDRARRALGAALIVAGVNEAEGMYTVPVRITHGGRHRDIALQGMPSDARPARIRTGPLILCVAALRPYKGVDVLIDAMARLRAEGIDVRCEIIGEGPLRPVLERRGGRPRLPGPRRPVGGPPPGGGRERPSRAPPLLPPGRDLCAAFPAPQRPPPAAQGPPRRRGTGRRRGPLPARRRKLRRRCRTATASQLRPATCSNKGRDAGS